MNFLLIGNGFDLAHGLPTTYSDFLSFVDKIILKNKENHFGSSSPLERGNVDEFIESLFTKIEFKELKIELLTMITDNVWINHFAKVKINQGWIDFESEISNVIKTVDFIKKKWRRNI